MCASGARFATSATKCDSSLMHAKRPRFEHAKAELELEIGDDHRQVGVAAALAVAVDRALHVARAGAHRGQGVGHAAARVVVRVDAERVGHRARHLGHDALDVPGHVAAVGLAQRHDLGAAADGGAQRLERVARVRAIAVEEVLGVVDDALLFAAQERDRVFDHAQVLVERGAQDLGHVERRGFAEDACKPRCRPRSARACSGRLRRASPARRVDAEGRDFGVLPRAGRGRARRTLRPSGFEPGQPPSMKVTPNASSCSAMRSLSSSVYEMPSRCVPSRKVVS